MRSSTLVAKTSHQSWEEVRDGSDRVEDLFRSASVDLRSSLAYIVGKHEGPCLGVLEGLDKGSLVRHVLLVFLSDLQSDHCKVFLTFGQPLGSSRVVWKLDRYLVLDMNDILGRTK